LKFKLFDMPGDKVLADGKVERVGREDAIFHYGNRATGHSVQLEGQSIPSYAEGIQRYLACLTDPETGVIADVSEIERVGFKTVLAKGFYGIHELTDEVLQAMEDYLVVAPAHNGPYLEAIRQIQQVLPGVKLVGVFETAFHTTIPKERRIYGVPYEWYEKYGIQRMGYHGASHGYIAEKLKDYRRVISCHLGGSASICAILDGKSMDNSFGFSLQMGIPHASRTGDVDVYIVPYLLDQGLTIEEIYHGLGKNGGLKGISGTSGDMRDIEQAISDGSERAELALKVFATSVLRYIGAYAMEIGGIDAIAFTGGIGENGVRLRRMVMEGMAHMGLKFDPDVNAAHKGEGCLTTADSAIAAYVIPANEEYMVVNETYKLCISAKQS